MISISNWHITLSINLHILNKGILIYNLVDDEKNIRDYKIEVSLMHLTFQTEFFL